MSGVTLWRTTLAPSHPVRQTVAHVPVFDDFQAASVTSCTSSPSRKVGQTGVPVSMAFRKSRISIMIWS